MLSRSFILLALVTAAVGCAQSPSPTRSRAPGTDEDAERRQHADETGQSAGGAKKSEKGSRSSKDRDRDEDDRSGDEDSKPKTFEAKERVTFAGSRGDTVPGYLWRPDDDEKHPAILLMYGISDSKESGTIALVGERLAADGFVAMTIDWPGTGERGKISNQERITNSCVKDWTVADYQKALDYLTSRKEVDEERLGYVGASMGAMTGLALAAKDARIKVIVPVVPILNPLWGEDDPAKTIRAVAPRPVLCLATADNSDFSGTVCQNVGAGGERNTLAGGHELQGLEDSVAKLASDFLKKHLQ